MMREGHKQMKSCLRMLLVGAAYLVLVAAANGQTQNLAAAQPPLGCSAGKQSLPTQRWVRDMRKKDLADIKRLLSPDIVFSDPDGTTYRGQTAVYDLYRKVFATFDSQLTMHSTSQVWDAGQRTCTEAGTFEEALRTRSDGSTKRFRGGYTFVFKLASKDRWLISEQKWTTN